MRKLYNTNIMESTFKYSSGQVFRYERMFVMGYKVSDSEFKINVKRNTVSQ